MSEQKWVMVPVEAKGLLESILRDLRAGFVVCEICGDQQDTATLDCVDDLEFLQTMLAAAPQASRQEAVPSDWQRMDISFLVDHLRQETNFDAGLIEQMLLFAQGAAAAPQAPAAPADPSHGALIKHAIRLLRLRQPVAPDVERVACDLELMLAGHETPAGAPSAAWLEVAAIAEKAPAAPDDSALAEVVEVGTQRCIMLYDEDAAPPPVGTKLYIAPQAAPAAPAAPDVAGLVEALGSMTCAYRMAVQAGHARITALGGDCDSVERMLADFLDYGRAVELYKSCRAALAAHQQREGE